MPRQLAAQSELRLLAGLAILVVLGIVVTGGDPDAGAVAFHGVLAAALVTAVLWIALRAAPEADPARHVVAGLAVALVGGNLLGDLVLGEPVELWAIVSGAIGIGIGVALGRRLSRRRMAAGTPS